MSAARDRIRRVARALGADRVAPTLSVGAPARGLEVPGWRILVATHHKTGTVWMLRIFQRVAADLGLDFANGGAQGFGDDADVYLHQGRGTLDLSGRELRGVHVVRDPRDVIVSGCAYHQHSTEPWLHEPDPALGGRTYQEAITALADPEDRLLFELEHRAARTVEQMLAWHPDPRILEVRYEDLLDDVDMVRFHAVHSHLGLRGRALALALARTWEHSLFGQAEAGGHVRSGRAGQHREVLTDRVRDAFDDRFPGALARLGYADDETVRTPDATP